MTLTTNMFARLRARQLGPNDFGGPIFTPEMEIALDTTIGTAAGNADVLFMDERTVAGGANDDLDLNGVLAGAFGAIVSMVEIVGVFIINRARSGAVNTTSLTVGAGTNPVTGYMGGTAPTFGPIRPGGFLMFGGPDAGGFGVVTPSTGDILRIANSAGSAATYQIAIIGRTA
jgi:hypothetical protein